jgi:hypothetical protein
VNDLEATGGAQDLEGLGQVVQNTLSGHGFCGQTHAPRVHSVSLAHIGRRTDSHRIPSANKQTSE